MESMLRQAARARQRHLCPRCSHPCTAQPCWPPNNHQPAGMLNTILFTPFARELCMLHGWCFVNRRTLLTRLRQGPGSAVAIIVGGAAEAVYAEVRWWQGDVLLFHTAGPTNDDRPHLVNGGGVLTRCLVKAKPANSWVLFMCAWLQPGTLDLVLLKRKGFVRVALEAGASLVPVLCFGENEQVSLPGFAPLPFAPAGKEPPHIRASAIPQHASGLAGGGTVAPAQSTHAPHSCCPQYHRIFVPPGGLVDRLQALTKKVRPRPCLWCWPRCCSCSHLPWTRWMS